MCVRVRVCVCMHARVCVRLCVCMYRMLYSYEQNLIQKQDVSVCVCMCVCVRVCIHV